MIVTTSWDDGHPLDSKLVELLDKYGVKGTFYIPLANAENKVMDRNQIKEISNNHEIGGHTLNHIYMNRLAESEAKLEIINCKNELEQLTGKRTNAFCFPGGKYSDRDIKLILNAGFSFGRTTQFFNTKINCNSYLMHTTVQVFHHNYICLLKHCIKRLMYYEFLNCLLYSENFIGLSKNYLTKNNAEVFHLWGHSWEIDKFNLWNELEDLFKLISKLPDIKFMSNSECWDYFKNS